MDIEAQKKYNDWVITQIEKNASDVFDSVANEEYEGITYISAEVKSISDKCENIALSSYGCELTVFFERYHTHLDMFEDDDHENEFKEAIELINDIVSEKTVLVTTLVGGEVVTSMLQEPNKIKKIESKVEKTEIKSWLGTYDQQ